MTTVPVEELRRRRRIEIGLPPDSDETDPAKLLEAARRLGPGPTTTGPGALGALRNVQRAALPGLQEPTGVRGEVGKALVRTGERITGVQAPRTRRNINRVIQRWGFNAQAIRNNPKVTFNTRLTEQNNELSESLDNQSANRKAGRVKAPGSAILGLAESFAKQEDLPRTGSEQVGRAIGGALTVGASEAPLTPKEALSPLNTLAATGLSGIRIPSVRPLATAAEATVRTRAPQAARAFAKAGQRTRRLIREERGALGDPRMKASSPSGEGRVPATGRQLALTRRPDEIRKNLDDLDVELIELNAEIEALETTGIIRPRWATGLTNQELEAIARQEGLNPFLPDWGDAIDSVVLREARQGRHKGLTDSVTTLRQGRAALKRELVFVRNELKEAELAEKAAPQVTRAASKLAREERGGPSRRIFHGTRAGETSSFIDDQGNLVLRSSSNFGGKTTGVSFSRDRETAVDFATRVVGGGGRRSRQGTIFEIDEDAITNQLFAEAADEIATRGAANVVIPKGRFRAVPVDEAVQGQLQAFETEGQAAVRALSNEDLGERAFRAEIRGETAEFEQAGEFGAFFGPGRRLTQGQEDVAARFGAQAVDDPLEPFITAEIKRRAASDPSSVREMAKGFSRLNPSEQRFPTFQGDPERSIRDIVGRERGGIRLPDEPGRPPAQRVIPEGPRLADPSGSTPRQATSGPVEPEGVLARVQAEHTPGETPAVSLLRVHEGSLRVAENEARIATDIGNQSLKAKGIGQTVQGRLAAKPEDIPALDDLFNALHNPSKVASGEVRLRAGFQDDFRRLQELTDMEEAMRIDFDPAMATVEDYFYRGWKAPEGLASGSAPAGARLGAKPGFTRPRAGAEYTEMRAAGFEPLFWNPYEQVRVSRLMGVRYRQQIQLTDDFKELGLAVPDTGGIATKGWRTPEVGPAFQGKPFAVKLEDGTTGVMFSRRWVVPDEMANRLENIYGKTPNLGKVNVAGKEIDLIKAVDVATFLPKRAKLFGSIFQQQDFLGRSLFGAWTQMVDQLLQGKPVGAVQALARWPKSAYQMIQANLGPGARVRIRQTLNSTEPILTDRPGVHFKGIVQAGLSTIDATLLPQNIDQVVRVAAQEAGVLGVKRVSRLVSELEGAMRRGLFEGLYPAAQISDIQNNIAPMLAKRFPKLSDRALNGMIARTTNVKYSTIPASQSVFQNRFVREFLRRAFFSIGESEGLLRQGTGAIRGPNAAFWRKHWLGAYLALAATANAIHFASTKEPLPFARYSPVAKDNFGPLPFSYNRDFMSPNIPLTGRSGGKLFLDIVGQMDTAFRLFDPIGFLSSRESVPVRAITTQITAKDFFGRPIDQAGPDGVYSRTAQLVSDLFLPIGPGQALAQGARAVIPGAERVIGESEGRIGGSGQLIQASGINVRAETTVQLLNRQSQEIFSLDYGSIEPYEQDAVQDAQKGELQQRQATGVEREQETSEYFALLQAVDDKRLKDLETLAGNIGKTIGREQGFFGQKVDDFFVVNQYFKIDDAAREQRDGISAALKPEFSEADTSTPEKAALAGFHALIEEAFVDGIFISSRLTTLRNQYMRKLSQPLREYVLRNTNRKPIPGAILRLLPKATRDRVHFSRVARDRHERATLTPVATPVQPIVPRSTSGPVTPRPTPATGPAGQPVPPGVIPIP